MNKPSIKRGKKEVHMAQKTALKKAWAFIAWVTGVLVSLAVGSGMVNGVLPIRWIPDAVTMIAGWIVIILALVGVIIAVVDAVQS